MPVRQVLLVLQGITLRSTIVKMESLAFYAQPNHQATQAAAFKPEVLTNVHRLATVVISRVVHRVDHAHPNRDPIVLPGLTPDARCPAGSMAHLPTKT